MAVITKSIGATGRDYSTITAWEADLDNGAIYAAGDDAVGECYDDAAFDEAVTINGGATVGLASRTLTVAAGHRHDGTAGTGARIVGSVSRNMSIGVPTALSWLEFDNLGTIVATYSSESQTTLDHLLVHNADRSGASAVIIDAGAARCDVLNCVVYDIVGASGSGSLFAIDINNISRRQRALNCTVYNVTRAGTGFVRGIGAADDASETLQNCISVDVGGTTSGTKYCFSPATNTIITFDHCLSSDTTALGTGSLTSKAASNQFVSTTAGSEDLHLKAGADAIDAGTDLVTTPTGVNIDINGRDRDAMGDTWDIGAHEYVAAGGGEETVNATTATAAATALASTLSMVKTVSASTAISAATALTATLSSVKSINASTAIASSTALAATVSTGGSTASVDASTAVAIATALSATISLIKTVNATSAISSATALAATLSLIKSVSSESAIASSLALSTTLAYDRTVTASFAVAAASALSATVTTDYTAPTTITNPTTRRSKTNGPWPGSPKGWGWGSQGGWNGW